MKRLFAKKFVTVVIDGSDELVMRNITYGIDLMKVVETVTNNKTYKKIRYMLEHSYPGLCIFNVTI